MIEGLCYCPRGMTHDGSKCVGQAETGICTQVAAMEVPGPAGSICFCPDGWIWSDANQVECLACTGGAWPNQAANQCVCPRNTAWDGTQCQAQAVAAEPQQVCLGGTVMTFMHGCQCPPGYGWDGSSCQGLVQQAPDQQVEIRQRTYQGSSSFTCCVNHARYTCPNDASFRACSTLSPNHGCARAGGC